MKDIKIKPIEINNDFNISNMSNKMTELQEKVVKDIAEKRQNLILNRLKELNISVDFKEESRRVFKRFASVRNGNEETILFNDGSIKGLRIITFVTKEDTNIKIDAKKFSLGYEISYY
jgi:hypothetical protein